MLQITNAYRLDYQKKSVIKYLRNLKLHKLCKVNHKLEITATIGAANVMKET